MLLNHFTILIGLGPNGTTALFLIPATYACAVVGTALVLLIYETIHAYKD